MSVVSQLSKALRRLRSPGATPGILARAPVMPGRGVFAMQQVKLPLTLPGRFFVVTYSRMAKTFALVVDDPDRSSYALGSEIPEIMRQFRIWANNAHNPRLADIGDSAVDIALEFGKAQAIIGDGRVIPLMDKQPEKTVADELARIEKEQDDGANSLIYARW